MKAPEIYQVTLWRKTGERSAMGSGEPQIFFAWTAAARFARQWMKNGPDFYAAIGHYEPPFSDRRALYVPAWDWFSATSGDVEYRGEHLDAPENIAAGSMWAGGLRGFQSHVSRGAL